MRGMNNTTGQRIEGIQYLQQRLRDVLTTPKGSRVMRRDFGCGLFERLDQDMNPAWLVQCYADIAEAISNKANGLIDFELEKIEPSDYLESGLSFNLTGIYKPTGERTTITVGDTQ